MESLIMSLRLVHSAEETSNGWVHPGLYVADKSRYSSDYKCIVYSVLLNTQTTEQNEYIVFNPQNKQ